MKYDVASHNIFYKHLFNASKSGILTYQSMEIDACLEQTSSGHYCNCRFWHFHADLMDCHVWYMTFFFLSNSATLLGTPLKSLYEGGLHAVYWFLGMAAKANKLEYWNSKWNLGRCVFPMISWLNNERNTLFSPYFKNSVGQIYKLDKTVHIKQKMLLWKDIWKVHKEENLLGIYQLKKKKTDI